MSSVEIPKSVTIMISSIFICYYMVLKTLKILFPLYGDLFFCAALVIDGVVINYLGYRIAYSMLGTYHLSNIYSIYVGGVKIKQLALTLVFGGQILIKKSVSPLIDKILKESSSWSSSVDYRVSIIDSEASLLLDPDIVFMINYVQPIFYMVLILMIFILPYISFKVMTHYKFFDRIPYLRKQT